ncbi:MAG: DUF2085 domain-containing protein [Polyangiaceae bacterium]
MSSAAVVPSERERARAKILRWFRALLVVLGVFPWVLPILRAKLPMGEVGVGLDMAFLTMCHRRIPRTLIFEGVPMPLCSRCAGIFLGIAIGAAIGRPILELRTWRWAFVGAGALMVADVVTQDLGIHPVWHVTRVATGLLVGYGMVIGFLSALARDKRRDAEPAPQAAE